MISDQESAPKYASGFLITTVTSIVAAVLALIYRYVCVWENKRRDKKYGTGEDEQAIQDGFKDQTDLQAKHFRYVL